MAEIARASTWGEVIDSDEVQSAFAGLTTAAIADACLERNARCRLAPPAIRSVAPGSRCAGRVRIVRCRGDMDEVLAALDAAALGEVIVVDNGGRTDEACIGGLVAMDATAAGLGGLIVWGCHRDTAHLLAIGLPVFSLGACPAAPRRPLEPRAVPNSPVFIGEITVRDGDIAFADDDGVLFVAPRDLPLVLAGAETIVAHEAAATDAIALGRPRRRPGHDVSVARGVPSPPA